MNVRLCSTFHAIVFRQIFASAKRYASVDTTYIDRVFHKGARQTNVKKGGAQRKADGTRSRPIEFSQVSQFNVISEEEKQRFFPITDSLVQNFRLGTVDRLLLPKEIDDFRKTSLQRPARRMAFDAQVLSTFRGANALQFFRSYLSRLLELGDVQPGAVLEAARTLSGMFMNGKANAGDDELVRRLLQFVDTSPMPELLALPAKVFLVTCTDRWQEVLDDMCAPSFSSVLLSACANAVACAALRARRIDLLINSVDRLDSVNDSWELNVANTCDQFLAECRRLAAEGQDEQCEKAFTWFLKRLQRRDKVVDEYLTKLLQQTAFSVKSSRQKDSIMVAKRAMISGDGHCDKCGTALADHGSDLTSEEHHQLTEAVLQTVIAGNNVYSNTTPVELTKFFEFLDDLNSNNRRPAVVVDGLNLFFHNNKNTGSTDEKYNLMISNVGVMKQGLGNSEMLVIGRTHLGRSRLHYQKLKSLASVFLVDALSQDDGFMLYAALKSGEQTLLVSNDLFGDHVQKLSDKDPRLGQLLVQWIRSRVARFEKYGRCDIQLPTRHRVAAQCDETESKWHVPYRREDQDSLKHISTWLCITPQRKLVL